MSNLSDDVALCSSALAALFRLMTVKGFVQPHEFTAVAAAAGLSEAQAAQFARGEVTLPPHQALTLLVAVGDRQRQMQVSAAAQRTAMTVAPVTAETVQAAMQALAGRFPGWKITVDELDSIPEFGPSRLLWHAQGDKSRFGNYAHQVAANERELGVKISAVLADEAAEKARMARYHRG